MPARLIALVPLGDGPSLEFLDVQGVSFIRVYPPGEWVAVTTGEDGPVVPAGCRVSGEDGQEIPFTRLPGDLFAHFRMPRRP